MIHRRHVSSSIRQLNMENLRVVVLSDASSPRLLWRLAQRVQNEVPGMTICGLIHDPGSHPEGRGRARECLRASLAAFGNLLLRWVHACPPDPNIGAEVTYHTLVRYGQRAGWPVARLDSGNLRPALDLVQEQRPDLCLALVSRPPARALLAMPRLGSVVVSRPHQIIRSSGLGVETQKEVKITVSWLQGAGEPTCLRAVSLPIEPYDTATSIAVKTDVVGSDLLMQSAASIAQDGVGAASQARCASQMLSYLSYCERRKPEGVSALRPMLDKRPVWKLFFISLLLSPYLLVRNWYRRWRRRFPVIILVHHLISDAPHHLGMPTEMFLRQVEFLQKHYRIVSLSEAVELLNSDAVQVPTVALSFDDGYQENFLTLRSVIEATGVPVSLFVCTSIIERQAEFSHDQTRGQHNFTALGWEQVAYLSRNGAEIGSHTCTHFDCGSSDGETLGQEIVGAKTDLQQRLGQRVRFFGFPFGQPENISAAAMQLAQSNYEYVLSSFGGENFAHAPRNETHLLRKSLPAGVWALELTLQGVLDVRRVLKRGLGWGAEAQEIARVQATAAGNSV